MSGAAVRTVGIRVSTEGADRARREVEQFGTAGEAALRRVEGASAAASPALQRLADASDVATRAFHGMGGSLGTVGSTFAGVSVADSAGAFARFAMAAKEVGATNDQVLRLVGGLQKAGIVAGASVEETGAATQQLAQALASGVLQGDELRSLLENMPQLAQALARELGVDIGQLRQMGRQT